MSTDIRFVGTTEELRSYIAFKKLELLKCKKSLSRTWDNREKISKIESLMSICDSVASLPIFKGKKMYMPELIEKVKNRRADYEKRIQETKAQVEFAQIMADRAYKEAGSFLSFENEDEYNSPEQVRARNMAIELETQKNNLKFLERENKKLWWLLGIINRPKGFFNFWPYRKQTQMCLLSFFGALMVLRYAWDATIS